MKTKSVAAVLWLSSLKSSRLHTVTNFITRRLIHIHKYCERIQQCIDLQFLLAYTLNKHWGIKWIPNYKTCYSFHTLMWGMIKFIHFSFIHVTDTMHVCHGWKPRPCVAFHNISFYGVEWLAPLHSASKIQDHPLSAVCSWWFNTSTATLHVCRKHHVVVQGTHNMWMYCC